MGSVERIVRFNAQTAGRESLIRYAKGGISLLEYLYKLRELEQYFLSCRRLLSLGRCSDQLYSALRSMQLNDPIVRMTLSTTKLWSSVQMLADHVLWLHQMGIYKIQDKQVWIDRANRFWLYSVITNLLRDFYELICLVQRKRSREKDNLDSELRNFKLSTPLKWMKANPKLSCDLVKNTCDFWIPYTAVNKIPVHSSVIGLLGIISTTMRILQIYNEDYRLSPS